MEGKVVTRFAPSPTGFMHVGGVRTALFAWLWARKNSGQFILRIEDTDKEREVEGSVNHIMESLKWLGLYWDQGPYIQSERLEIYKKYANILIGKGLAYADPYTEEEIENFRKKADDNKKPFLFREHRPENPPTWDGTKPLRFKVSEIKRTVWNDVVWGELSAGPEALDDFILIKSDGYPTYNFAHIVDDIEMQVTHVVRGQEFISSTPKFLSLYEALGAKPPHFVTTPPIMAPDGKKKLSKRDGAKDILEYQKEGYLPDAMINYLAFLGFNPGGEKEVYTRDELIQIFDLSKIQRGGARWDDAKLDWMNKEHLKLLPREEIEQNILKRSPKDMNPKLVPLIFERINKWGEVESVASELSYLFDNIKDDKLQKAELPIWKDLNENPNKFTKTKEYLEEINKLLKPLKATDWNYDFIKNSVWDYATQQGKGHVLWPMRIALSFEEKTPDPFKLAELLGKAKTLERIERTIKILEGVTVYTIQNPGNVIPFSKEIEGLNTTDSTGLNIKK